MKEYQFWMLLGVVITALGLTGAQELKLEKKLSKVEKRINGIENRVEDVIEMLTWSQEQIELYPRM